MNVHKNAPLAPRGRALMVSRIVDEGWTVAASAAAAGVSERTAYKWLGRHRRGPSEDFKDRSSAPRRCPRRTSPQRTAEIERLRRERRSGPAIARILGLPRSTVGAVLRRLGLGKLKDLDPKPPVVRYERSRPGEMIHLDIKKLGRFELAGHRITGDRQAGRSRRVGWDFLHVCVDDASRLAYTEILPSERQEDTTAFLERALAWLARHGVTVERVMTDNGSAYRSKLFARALKRAGLRHVRTRPYTPRTNGKAERFIQTSERQEDTTAFLERALAWLARHGVTVERVMTDNGSAYRSKLFARALKRAGLRHVRTRPYTPRTNGKAERFIQTSLREWAYAKPYRSSDERSHAIGPWTDAYNLARPHSGIGGLSPWQRLNNLLGNDT